MKILTGEDNLVLRAISKPVEKFGPELKKLVEDMREQMFKSKGLGLAAPQVGKSIRVCLVCLNHDTPAEMIIPMVNPKISAHKEDCVLGEEGCLSLPGFYGNVERWTNISVDFHDTNGDKHFLQLDDLNARVVQHEIDHLDGILFVDRVKKIKQIKNPL